MDAAHQRSDQRPVDRRALVVDALPGGHAQVVDEHDVEASDGRGNMQVAGLRLDDLELASLRGRVERAKLSMDLREKLGAATLRVQQGRSMR